MSTMKNDKMIKIKIKINFIIELAGVYNEILYNSGYNNP